MLQHLDIILGEDMIFDIPVLLDGAVPEAPIDEWAFALRFFAKRCDEDDAALAAFTSGAGEITIFNSEDRIARVKFTKAKMDALVCNKKHWWRLTATHGDTSVLQHGYAFVSR